MFWSLNLISFACIMLIVRSQSNLSAKKTTTCTARWTFRGAGRDMEKYKLKWMIYTYLWLKDFFCSWLENLPTFLFIFNLFQASQLVLSASYLYTLFKFRYIFYHCYKLECRIKTALKNNLGVFPCPVQFFCFVY